MLTDGSRKAPMVREPVPSAILTRLLEAAKELEEWAVGHRQATLAEHERAVLRIFRSVMGPTLGAVLERALQLDQPAAQRQHAACPEGGKRRPPPQRRERHPMTGHAPPPLRPPSPWCPTSHPCVPPPHPFPLHAPP